MNKHNSPKRPPSHSLGPPLPHTYSDDHESDLEQRESPKPTLSTNRISKSKSQQSGSFRLAPQLHPAMSSDRNEFLFSSERQQEQRSLDPMLTEFVGQWQELTRTQLETISHLKQQRHAIRESGAQLKLQFLLTLWQVEALRYKLHNVRLNIGVIHVQLEARPSADRNKLIVLELLQKKLGKKLFFAAWRFDRLLVQVDQLMKEGRKQELVTDRKLIECELIMSALERIVGRRLTVALTAIKKSVFIGNLFSPGSNEEVSEDEEEHPRNIHLSPSALQLTLSPNNYPTEKSSAKRPYSFFKQHPMIQVVAEQEEPEQSTRRFPLAVESVSIGDIVELRQLIANLESDMRRATSHYWRSVAEKYRQNKPGREQESTEEVIPKIRQAYFNKWKIAFLRKHMQANVDQRYRHSLVGKVFEGWRSIQPANIQQAPSLNNQAVSPEAGSSILGDYVMELKARRKHREFRRFIGLLGDRKHLAQLNNLCRHIYQKTLRTKALYGLLLNWRERSDQPPEEASQQGYPEEDAGTYQQSEPLEEYAEYSDHHDESQQSVQPDLQADHQEDRSKTSFAAEVMWKHNTLMKTFLQMKLYYRLRKATRFLSRTVKRISFRQILAMNEKQNRLDDKLQRFSKQKDLSLLFKCFSALKRCVYGKPGRPSIQHLVKAKNRTIQQTYFSVMKLLWKMRKIKQRKADRLRQLHSNFRCFSAMKVYAVSRQHIGGRRRQLENLLFNRNCTTFMRNMIRSYLERRQLQSKTQHLMDLVFDRQTQNIRQFLQSWKRATVGRRSFDRVEERLTKLKNTQTKRKIFQQWWQQVYGTPRLSGEPVLTTAPPSPSGEHRYWLERYYQKLLSK